MLKKWELRVGPIRVGLRHDDVRERAEVGGRRRDEEEVRLVAKGMFPGARLSRRVVQKSFVRLELAADADRVRRGLATAEKEGFFALRVDKLGREVMG